MLVHLPNKWVSCGALWSSPLLPWSAQYDRKYLLNNVPRRIANESVDPHDSYHSCRFSFDITIATCQKRARWPNCRYIWGIPDLLGSPISARAHLTHHICTQHGHEIKNPRLPSMSLRHPSPWNRAPWT